MLKNNLPIHIAADDREHKSEVIESLSQIEDVDLTICRLSMGDYRIDHRLVVERKTLKDFAISIIDGRLFKQMIRLANSDSKAVLIIEGIASDIAELGMTRESMQGALITVSLILGIPVLRSKNPSETARLMVYIGRQMESMAIGGMQRHGYRPKGKRKRQLFILQGLPGVGPGRAARLLNHFGSVEAAISASSSEIQSVNGFGQGVADKIRWAVTERVSPYKTYIEGAAPEIAANTLICLVHQTNYLLDQQLRQLEKQFLEQGGFTEKLYSARQKARK